MIGLVAISSAWADPAALRVPERGPAVVLGLEEQSVGVPIRGVDLALESRSDGGAFGASVGFRRQLEDLGRGWRIDAGCAVGLVVPTFAPSLGWTVTPWSSLGVVGRRAHLQGVFAFPVASSFDQGLRIPVRAELQGGLNLGPLQIGPRIGLGAVWAPGIDVSVQTGAALAVTWRR